MVRASVRAMAKDNKPRPPFPEPPVPWVEEGGPFFPSPDNVFSTKAAADFNRDLTKHEAAVALGKKSGESRQAEAEEGWLPHALELAVKVREEDKGITQIDLAAEIKNRWKLKIRCPRSMLVQAISEWEDEGKLPRRNK
jgi:hypothetical protein